ncbi:MAG: glutamine amidotransferase [Sandaracinaceae bacterium]|nr:glutamine amidotransferase [Sandaracinaceae bacterium]
MRQTFILKTGGTLPVLRAERGDYDEWITDALGVPAQTIRVAEGEPLPSPREAGAVVVTGSSAMVTDRLEWSVRSGDWLARVVEQGGAVLGICYGHQLLADALGGEVGPNPRGREMGTVHIEQTREGRQDPLLGALRDPLVMQASHRQSVLRPPPGARVLATSEGDPCQCFAWGERVWGVQFHPEWDHVVVRTYLEDRRAILDAEGLDASAMIERVRSSEDGQALLRRFSELCLLRP